MMKYPRFPFDKKCPRRKLPWLPISQITELERIPLNELLGITDQDELKKREVIK